MRLIDDRTHGMAIGVLALAVLWLSGSLIAAMLRVKHDLGVLLLFAMTNWLGFGLGLFVARMQADYLFRPWLQVLPLSHEAILRHWRKTTSRRVLALGVGLAGAVLLPAALVGLSGAVLPGLVATALISSAMSLGLALLLGPWRMMSGYRVARAFRTPKISGVVLARWIEPARAVGMAVWQCRRRWTLLRWIACVAVWVIAWGFGLAVGRAQYTLLPILLVALVSAVVVFNQSLDPSMPYHPAVRNLPLTTAQKIRAWLYAPLWLSAACFLFSILVALPWLPWPGWSFHFFMIQLMTVLAWVVLCLLRICVCLRYPRGRLQRDLTYFLSLVLVSVLGQSLGPLGLALAVVFLGIDSRLRVQGYERTDGMA